jgi:hypothetical protein
MKLTWNRKGNERLKMNEKDLLERMTTIYHSINVQRPYCQAYLNDFVFYH